MLEEIKKDTTPQSPNFLQSGFGKFPQNQALIEKHGGITKTETINGGTQTTFGDGWQTFEQGKSPVVNDIIAGAPPAVSNTSGIRDDIKEASNVIGSGINDAESGTENISSILDRLTTERNNIGEFSEEQLAQIEQAGAAAGSAYQPMVDKATEDRRITLPKNIVAGGERGGFMNTQFAGATAYSPQVDKKPGEAFVGIGGEFDRARINLDRNVSLVKAKQQEAIAAAKAAERQFIKTGQRQDFNDAMSLVKLAQDFKNDEENLLIKKQNLLLNVAQEERLSRTSDFNIASSIPEGETVTIGGVEYTGIMKENIDPFFTGSNIISLMKALPVGTTQEITDLNTGRTMTVVGLQSNDPTIKTIQSTDDAGNVTITSYRLTPDGGAEIINQASAGRTGKSKTAPVSLIIRKETGEAVGKMIDDFDSNRGEDGKVAPSFYGEQQKKFIRLGLGDANDFKDYFDPTEELNQDDPNSLQFFQSSRDVVTGSESLERPLFK